VEAQMPDMKNNYNKAATREGEAKIAAQASSNRHFSLTICEIYENCQIH
jgi:hypothetical protein